jgi:hypothetical protein
LFQLAETLGVSGADESKSSFNVNERGAFACLKGAVLAATSGAVLAAADLTEAAGLRKKRSAVA